MTVSDENEIVIYESNDGLVRVDVTLDGDTVWLSLDQLAQLFGRDKSTISRHIKNIYAEGELDQEATVAKNATVQTEGDRRVRREISEAHFGSCGNGLLGAAKRRGEGAFGMQCKAEGITPWTLKR